MNKEGIFISYSHEDAKDFVRWLAFALSFHIDVYWDRKLKSGQFSPQLYAEIEKREFFLLVMSSNSLRNDGWCMKELAHAQKHNDNGIILARIHTGPEFINDALTAKYTYADFTDDFETGFRRLTEMMFGKELFSWEYIASISNDKIVLECLGKGYVPGQVAKELSKWVVVERVWRCVMERLKERYGDRLIIGSPRTPEGVCRQCKLIMSQLQRDAGSNWFVQNMREIAYEYVQSIQAMDDSEHKSIGQKTADIIERSRKLLKSDVDSRRTAYPMASLSVNYDFDVADKLRELIRVHARRSRY